MQANKNDALRLGLLLFCAGVLGASQAAAQPPAAPAQQAPIVPLTVKAINKRVYWALGPSTSNNSNNGFIIADHGVILFDTKNTLEDERAVLAEVAKVTAKPVTHVFISHSDGDHINGLPVLPKGVIIESQRYANRTMETSAARGGQRAANPDYLPTRLLDSHETLTVDGVRIELFHFAPAHTGGDLVMYLPDDKIVFMGDILISEIPEPFVHMDNGASPDGVVTSIKAMAALNADTYVSGHGPIVGKAELQRRAALYEAKIARVKGLIAQGKTLAEITATLNEAPTAPGPRGPLPKLEDYVYQAATKKN